MSSELDLSLLKNTFRRRWWIVLICVLVALAIAVGISLLQAQRYEAANTLLVQSPRYQWRFDGSITAITDLRRDFQREILAIARGDEIAQSAAQSLLAAGLQEPVTPQTLKSAIMVRAGDGNTIVVTAIADDPERAAAYASAWTQALVSAARDVYGAVEDLASFQAELQNLEQQLQSMEDALAETRARTGLFANINVPDEVMQPSIHLQELSQISETLAGYRVTLYNLQQVQRALSEAGPGTDLAQLPWELLGGPILSQRAVISPDIARANLNDPARLLDLLQREESALQATADALQEEANRLQAALAADWKEFDNSVRERNQVRDTHQVLQRKVNELSLQERLDPSLLTIVGSAEPLVTQVRASMLGLLATAAVAGLIVGILVAVWVELSSRKDSGLSTSDHA